MRIESALARVRVVYGVPYQQTCTRSIKKKLVPAGPGVPAACFIHRRRPPVSLPPCLHL